MRQTVETNRSLLERRLDAVPRGPFQIAPIFVARAEGHRLWDADGKEYVDFCGGIGVLNVGHNHPKVVAAIRGQLDRFIHTCWHVAMYDEYLRLAERLNDLSPCPGPTKSVFFNSGAEAVENAVKVARVATKRIGVVAFERGFHGRTLLGLTLTGKVRPYSAGFGPFVPEVHHLPYEPFFGRKKRTDAEVERECREALDHLFAYRADANSIACVVLEPVLGEGGFLPAHPVAVRVLREVTREKGILLAADEVQSGFGRCGSLFACGRYGLEPDMLLVAKSLAGGMPLSGLNAPASILDAPEVGGIGGTYGGNPLACAAANAVLDVIEEEGLADRANEIGRIVMETFDGLVAESPVAGDARGLGAMCGLEIVSPETGAPDPDRAKAITARCLEGGVLVMTASGNVLRTLMPLTIPIPDLERALEVVASAVRASR